MRIVKYITLILHLFILVSCSQEMFPEFGSQEASEVSLNFAVQGMTVKPVVSRGADAKNDDEKRINSLHIFLFDENGDYLVYDNKPAYIYVGTNTTPKIVQTKFATTSAGAAKNATIYAVANVEKRIFSDDNNDGKPDNFSNLNDLKNYIYTPQYYSNWLEIPDADNDGQKDMPMVGMVEEKDLTVASAIVEVKMRALMTRVDVKIHLKSQYSDVENDYPQLSISELRMNNIPKGVAFTATAENNTTSDVEYWDLPIISETKTLYNGHGEYVSTYYLFENMQQPMDYTYPTGIKDDEKQAHKPLRASENATNFIFTGNFIDYNGNTFKASYTLYLGSNHTDNFELKRNFQYKNDICITGLTKSKLPCSYVTPGNTVDIYGFDARVDVNLTDSKFYVSMFRERDIDAHASVVPMDIYTDGSNVKVSIVNPSEDNWIRMEYVPNSVMSGNSYKPYTGIRDYFTSDLVTSELKDKHTIQDCENRSRIYFYVDENVDIDANLNPAPAREAQICIESGDTQKYITLKQPGLRKVTVVRENKEGGILGIGSTTYQYSFVFYIEEYEEYLNHYDPLDVYNNTTQMYEGLPWSTTSSGKEIGNGYATNTDYNADIYINGAKVTKAILSAYDSPSNRIYIGKPGTAAEYCNNKNKRKIVGGTCTIDDSKGIWYLPGISELESMMTIYWADFKDFQNKYYWSCAPAKKRKTFASEEEPEYARASKTILDDNGEFTYAESYNSDGNSYCDYASGKGGFAKRTTELRIRAAYVPKTNDFFSNTSNLTRTHFSKVKK